MIFVPSGPDKCSGPYRFRKIYDMSASEGNEEGEFSTVSRPFSLCTMVFFSVLVQHALLDVVGFAVFDALYGILRDDRAGTTGQCRIRGSARDLYHVFDLSRCQ
jgi:hypothetical protein